jgi:biopolymer transport protein TolR
VFIRADATAEYALVADVMARLSSAGFTNLGLVTDTRDRSGTEREDED